MLNVCVKCPHLSEDRQTCHGGEVPVALHIRMGRGEGAICPRNMWEAAAITGGAIAGGAAISPACSKSQGATVEEVSRRLEVCRGCEHVGAEGADGASVYCGTCRTCSGGRGRMVSLTVGRCPMGRW